MNEYAQQLTVSQSAPSERATFIRRTYAHLAAAILLFLGLEAYLITQTALPRVMIEFMANGQFAWLMILGAFMLCGWLARGLAVRVASPSMQYAGLTLYVIAEAVIFVPMIYMAKAYSSPEVLPTAGILTLLLFVGLTAVVFITRKDFSFLGSIITIGGFVALGLIICAACFGFSLGLVFSGAMILLAGGAILYDTSKVLHHCRTDQHVAASLQLFASIALLFWYVLRILMSLNRR